MDEEREIALRLANCGMSPQGMPLSDNDIVERARKFYRFLTVAEPEHAIAPKRPKPKAPTR